MSHHIDRIIYQKSFFQNETGLKYLFWCAVIFDKLLKQNDSEIDIVPFST